MESNHTKGPWKAGEVFPYEDNRRVILWPDKGGTHMRRLDYQGTFTGPDARLIAAAPELLAAAIAVIERWDTPTWKDVPATANYINALRHAVAIAMEQTRETLKMTNVDLTGVERPVARRAGDRLHDKACDVFHGGKCTCVMTNPFLTEKAKAAFQEADHQGE